MLDKEGIAIFGVSTVGEFTEEGVDSGSIVLLLLDLNKDYFRIAIKDHKDGSAIASGQYIGNEGLKGLANGVLKLVNLTNLNLDF